MRSLNLNGIFLASKLKPREFQTSVFLIGGAVTFTLSSWSSLLRRIPDKNDRCDVSHDIASSEKWCQCLDKKVQDFSVVKQNSNMCISK
jgi:hypothetical protein